MCVCQCFSFQIDVHDQMYQRLPGSSGQPPLFFGYPWHTFFVWMVFIILHAFSFSCLRAKLSSCSSFSVSICVCVLFTQWERWISSGDLVENPLYSPSQLESHKLKSLLLFHAGGFSALVMSRTNTTTIWECWGFGTYSYLCECVRVEWSVLTCWRF